MDWLGLAPYLCRGRCLVLWPQGLLQTPLGNGAAGYGWFPASRGEHRMSRQFLPHAILLTRQGLWYWDAARAESWLTASACRLPNDLRPWQR